MTDKIIIPIISVLFCLSILLLLFFLVQLSSMTFARSCPVAHACIMHLVLASGCNVIFSVPSSSNSLRFSFIDS